jgi:hypothetical protein
MLAPLTRQIGRYLQILTSARGDFLYTDGWTKNFDGLKNVVEHYKRTESPRRVMPVNAYFHFYLGEREEGLRGLEEALRYAETHEIAPLFASEYTDIVRDALSLRIFRLGDGWRVLNSGALRTVRFDGGKRKAVDLARSRGVLGYRRINGSLYVSLDEGMTHDVFLADSPTKALYLESASHYVDGWAPSESGVRFSMRGLGKARAALRGLAPERSYRVEVRRVGSQEEPLLDKVLRADADGRMEFRTEFTGYRGRYAVSVRRAS